MALFFFNEPISVMNYFLPNFFGFFYIGVTRGVFSFLFFNFLMVMCARSNNEGYEAKTKMNKMWRWLIPLVCPLNP